MSGWLGCLVCEGWVWAWGVRLRDWVVVLKEAGAAESCTLARHVARRLMGVGSGAG